MFLGPPSSVTKITVSGFQTKRFLWDRQPRPFPLTTVCSVSASRWPAAPGPSQALQPREPGGECAEASAVYYLESVRTDVGRWESSRQVAVLAGMTPQHNRPEARVSILDRWYPSIWKGK